MGIVGQTPDNSPVIELSATDFSIDRSFTVSIIIPNSTTRPSVSFPAIPGLSKSGTTASVTTNEINGKSVVSQIITQDYRAQVPGTYKVAPFALLINGLTVRSPGATLMVRPVAGKTNAPASATAALAIAEKGGAFLSLTTSRTSVYEGEGFMLKLTFYAAENYPYELRFDQIERQLQTIIKQIRPPGAWEENAGISELKSQLVKVGNRSFREFVMYQATFFPLRSQLIRLPAVTLRMQQVKTNPAPLPTAPTAATQTEPVSFTSQPVTITVKPLPVRATATLIPVGTFRLVDRLGQSTVGPGQSTAYEFRIEGEGNMAALPPPTVRSNADFDVFPPEIRLVINRKSSPLTGQKLFRYFLVPKQKGRFPLVNTFQWVYFNTQTARYDTLRSQLSMQVGGQAATFGGQLPDSTRTGLTETDGQPSIYTGISQLDSTDQPLNFPVLVRAVANVLIVVMILGMIYIFFKK